MKTTCLFLFFSIFSSSLFSQTHSFEFLKLSGNATLSALGGVNVSPSSLNANSFQSNPAVANDTTNGWGSDSYLFYVAGIGMANFSYQHDFNKVGALSFGVQHLTYGQIQGYDAILG